MNPKMLNQLKKMRKEMEDAQFKLESTEFFGKASGIVVIVQGTRQVIDVKIDSELLEEKDMLEDAILIAVNDALAQIDKQQEETLGQFSGGMPGLGF